MSKRRNRAGGLVVLGAPILAVVLAMIVLNSSAFLRWVREPLLALANDAINGQIVVGTLDGSLLGGKLDLGEIALLDTDGRTLVSLRSAHLEFELMPLLNRRLVVTQAVLDGANVAVWLNERGDMNFASLAKDDGDLESSGPIEFAVDIRAVTLSRANVTFADLEREADGARWVFAPVEAYKQVDLSVSYGDIGSGVAARDVSLSGSASIDLAGPIRVRFDALTADVAVSHLLSAPVAAHGGAFLLADDGRMGVSITEIAVGDIFDATQVAYTLGNADDMSGSLTVKSNHEALSRWLEAFGIALEVKSDLDADLSAIIEGSNLEFQVDAQTKDAGSLKASGTVIGFADDNPKFSIAASTQGLRAERWTSAPIDSTINATLVASGVGFDPLTMNAQGTLSIEDSQIDDYTIQRGLVEFSKRANAIDIGLLAVDSPYANIRGTGQLLDDATFKAELRARSGDVLPSKLAALLTKNLSVRADIKTSGRLDFGAELPIEMIPELEIDATWNLRDFRAESTRVDQSEGTLEAKLSSAKNTRSITWDVDASGSGLAVKTTRLDRYSIKTRGRATIDATLPDDVLDLVTTGDIRGRISVENLKMPGIRLRSTRLNGTVEKRKNRKVAAQVKGHVKGLSHAASKVRVGNVSGEFEGEATLDKGFAPTTMKLSTTLNGEGIDAAGIKLKTATVAADLEGPTGDLRGGAVVVATDLEVETVAFSTVEAQLKLEQGRRFSAKVKGKQSTRAPENVEFELTGGYEPKLAGWHVDDVQLTTIGESWVVSKGLRSKSDGTLEFNKVSLTHGNKAIQLDGTFRPGESQDIRIVLTDFEIDAVGREFGIDALAELQGEISGTVSLTGTSQEPEIDFDIVLRDIYASGAGPFDARLIGSFAKEWLSLQTVEVSTNGLRVLEGSGLIPCRITTTGEFTLYTERDVTIDIEFSDLDTIALHEPIPILSEYDATGTLGGELLFHGTLDDPNLDVDLKATDLGFVIPGESLDSVARGLNLAARLEYSRPQDDGSGGFKLSVDFEDEYGQRAELQASSSGALARWIRRIQSGTDWSALVEEIGASAFRLYMVIPSLDLGRSGLAAAEKAKAEGRLEVYFAASGTFANPVGNARVRLLDVGWNRFRDINLDASIEIGGQAIALTKLVVDWDNDRVLTATANVPLPLKMLIDKTKLADLPIQAKIEMPNLPIGKLSAVDYAFASVTGNMKAAILIEGSLERPQLGMEIDLSDLLMADRRKGQLKVRAGARSGRLTASIEALTQGGDVSFRTEMPLNIDLTTLGSNDRVWIPDGPIKGHLRAKDVDLGSLVPARLLDGYIAAVKGQLNSNIDFGGTVESPGTTGTLGITNLSAKLPALGRKLDGGAVHLEFDERGLNIVEFFVGEGPGYVDVKGRVDGSMLSPKRIDVDISLKELGTSGFTPMPTYVTGNTKIEVDLSAIESSLSIDVRDLEIVIPDVGQGSASATELHSDIKVLRPREREQKLITREGIASFRGDSKSLTKIQIKVAPGWIRHPNANIEVKGDLLIEAKGDESKIYGTIEALQGELEMLNKNFRVVSGLLTFRGDSPPNPRLQLEAEYIYSRNVADALGAASSGEPRATIRVAGTALDPKLKMYSDPSLEESEVVYVLVTDRAPITATSGQEDGVSSQAMAAATGLLSGLLKSRADQIYPVDMIRLDSDESGISGVEVGKYFGADFFFAYEVQFSPDEDENQNTARVEYQFAPRWLVGTRMGDRGNGSVFIFWKVL